MRHRPFRFPRSRARIAAVDEQAFTTELERHRDELQRHCVRMLGSRPDGDDALQETLLRAWRARRTLASDCSRAWLYRIATNACVDMLRRRDAVVMSLDDQTTEPSAPSDQRPDALLLSRETLELALLTAIQHLSAREQAAFVMRDILSWSADEAAASLSTSVPATNSALQRARRRLRERLAPGRLDWTRAAPCAAERRTLDRYLSAIEARSTETAARLLAAA
jgi:RNA polymerase sigma-70 factor, ECF subfamily